MPLETAPAAPAAPEAAPAAAPAAAAAPVVAAKFDDVKASRRAAAAAAPAPAATPAPGAEPAKAEIDMTADELVAATAASKEAQAPRRPQPLALIQPGADMPEAPTPQQTPEDRAKWDRVRREAEGFGPGRIGQLLWIDDRCQKAGLQTSHSPSSP